MIYGNINRLNDYGFYPAPVRVALDFLKENDIEKMNSGEYEIEGRDIYIQIQEIKTDYAEIREAESHEKFVDVQYLVSGRECIGHSVLSDASVVKKDLRPEKDLIYYNNPEGETMLTMLPGDFAVFFPTDIHRPGSECDGPMNIKKAVVKIRYDLIK